MALVAEIMMSTQSRNQIKDLIEGRLGLAHHFQGRAYLDSVLDDLAHNELESFAAELQHDSQTAWQRLIQALVIGETYFFRNRSHFDLLRTTILPEIITRHRQQHHHALNIWSAGCATGEETYSLAITLYETLTDLANWHIRLIGSDVNRQALAAAEQGIYRNWSFRQTERQFQGQYFNALESGLQIKAFIRDKVSFLPHNLLDGNLLTGLDLIFCCNVLLYFEKSRVFEVEERFFEALQPGGWLILGQAEAIQFKRERWTMHIFPGAVAYQKPLTGNDANIHYNWGTPAPHPTTPPPEADKPASNALTQTTYAEAIRLMRTKQYPAAEAMLNTILLQNPGHAAARILFGSLLANRQDFDAAHAQLKHALQLDALQADAHYLKGVLFLETEQNDEAADALRAALYCQRGHPLAAMILGHLYLQQGDQHKARRTWAEALDSLRDLAPQTPVSDLSDLTAESLHDFLEDQLSIGDAAR